MSGVIEGKGCFYWWNVWTKNPCVGSTHFPSVTRHHVIGFRRRENTKVGFWVVLLQRELVRFNDAAGVNLSCC